MLQDIQRQQQSGPPLPESVVRALIGLAKAIHDMALPPVGFDGTLSVNAGRDGTIEVNVWGRVPA